MGRRDLHPAGRYDTAADGSLEPGTFREVDSPLSAGERVEQLILPALHLALLLAMLIVSSVIIAIAAAV